MLASLILFYTLLCNAYCIRFLPIQKLLHRMPCVGICSPIIAIQLGAAYRRREMLKALLLTLSKQGFS
jgi:hypothetical protein